MGPSEGGLSLRVHVPFRIIPMDIATGLSALKTSTDLLRALRDRLKSDDVKREEVIGRIGEIYDYIVESKDALVDAKDEIHQLKDKLRNKTMYEHRFNAVWRRIDEGGYIGPFCPICHADGKDIPLKWSSHSNFDGTAIGMTCQVFHQDGKMNKALVYIVPRSALPVDWFYEATPPTEI
jgi:hypothetical protein